MYLAILGQEDSRWTLVFATQCHSFLHSIVQNKINIKLYRKFKHIKGRSERFNICNNRNFTSNVRILQRIEIMEEEKTSNS